MTKKTTKADVLEVLAAKRGEAEARLSSVLGRINEVDERRRDLSIAALDDKTSRDEVATLHKEARGLRGEREWLEAALAEISELEALEAAREKRVARKGAEARARARADERVKLAHDIERQMTELAAAYRHYDELGNEIVAAWPESVQRNRSPLNGATERDQMRVGAAKAGLDWLVNGGSIPGSILGKRPTAGEAAARNVEQFFALNEVVSELPTVSEGLNTKLKLFFSTDEANHDS